MTGGSRSADAALLLVAALWGTTFTLVKAALADSTTLAFLALRFGLGMLVLAPLALRAPKRAKDIRGGIAAGLALAAAYILQTAGLRFTSAANSAFLTGLYVVTVPFLTAVVYRVMPGWREWLGAFLALGGTLLMTGIQYPLALSRGDALTLASTVAYGLQPVILARFAGGEASVLAWTQVATVGVAAAVLCPLEQPRVAWTPALVTGVATTGILATAVVFWLQAWGLKRVPPSRAAVLFATEPVFASIFAYFWSGEVLTGWAWAGGVLILTGILVVEVKPARATGNL